MTTLWGLLALVFAREAVASGSSELEGISGAVRISAATPSIAFEDPAQESEFHRTWQAEARVVVDRALGLAAAEVASWTKRERRQLAPWSADAVCRDSPLVLPRAPAMTMSQLELCFAENPERDVAEALIARLVAAIGRP